MARFIFLFFAGCLFLTSCKDDCPSAPPELEPQLLKLKSTEGQDLWFGSAAIFNPDSLLFTKKANGDTVAFTVDRTARVVILDFPATGGANRELRMRLTAEDTDGIQYRTELEAGECFEEKIITYIRYEGVEACSRCGDGRFNVTKEVILKKQL